MAASYSGGRSTASLSASSTVPLAAIDAASDEHAHDSTSFAASAVSPASSMTFFSTTSGEPVRRR